VTIQRPSGRSEQVAHEGGLLRYDRTDEAGWYVIRQGDRTIRRAVNFLDPVESNLSQPPSTWFGVAEPAAQPERAEGFRSFGPEVLGLLLALLLAEWIAYAWRARRRRQTAVPAPPSPTRDRDRRPAPAADLSAAPR
jgi:hypothetical protein